MRSTTAALSKTPRAVAKPSAFFINHGVTKPFIRYAAVESGNVTKQNKEKAGAVKGGNVSVEHVEVWRNETKSLTGLFGGDLSALPDEGWAKLARLW